MNIPIWAMSQILQTLSAQGLSSSGSSGVPGTEGGSSSGLVPKPILKDRLVLYFLFKWQVNDVLQTNCLSCCQVQIVQYAVWRAMHETMWVDSTWSRVMRIIEACSRWGSLTSISSFHKTVWVCSQRQRTIYTDASTLPIWNNRFLIIYFSKSHNFQLHMDMT